MIGAPTHAACTQIPGWVAAVINQNDQEHHCRQGSFPNNKGNGVSASVVAQANLRTWHAFSNVMFICVAGSVAHTRAVSPGQPQSPGGGVLL